jgi:preprotein translocase subunit YajC
MDSETKITEISRPDIIVELANAHLSSGIQVPEATSDNRAVSSDASMSVTTSEKLVAETTSISSLTVMTTEVVTLVSAIDSSTEDSPPSQKKISPKKGLLNKVLGVFEWDNCAYLTTLKSELEPKYSAALEAIQWNKIDPQIQFILPSLENIKASDLPNMDVVSLQSFLKLLHHSLEQEAVLDHRYNFSNKVLVNALRKDLQRFQYTERDTEGDLECSDYTHNLITPVLHRELTAEERRNRLDAEIEREDRIAQNTAHRRRQQQAKNAREIKTNGGLKGLLKAVNKDDAELSFEKSTASALSREHPKIGIKSLDKYMDGMIKEIPKIEVDVKTPKIAFDSHLSLTELLKRIDRDDYSSPLMRIIPAAKDEGEDSSSSSLTKIIDQDGKLSFSFKVTPQRQPRPKVSSVGVFGYQGLTAEEKLYSSNPLLAKVVEDKQKEAPKGQPKLTGFTPPSYSKFSNSNANKSFGSTQSSKFHNGQRETNSSYTESSSSRNSNSGYRENNHGGDRSYPDSSKDSYPSRPYTDQGSGIKEDRYRQQRAQKESAPSSSSWNRGSTYADSNTSGIGRTQTTTSNSSYSEQSNDDSEDSTDSSRESEKKEACPKSPKKLSIKSYFKSEKEDIHEASSHRETSRNTVSTQRPKISQASSSENENAIAQPTEKPKRFSLRAAFSSRTEKARKSIDETDE